MAEWADFYDMALRGATQDQGVRTRFAFSHELQDDGSLQAFFWAADDGFLLVWAEFHPTDMEPTFRIDSVTGEIPGQCIKRMASVPLPSSMGEFPWPRKTTYGEQPSAIRVRSFALYLDPLVLVTRPGIDELRYFIHAALGLAPNYVVLDI